MKILLEAKDVSKSNYFLFPRTHRQNVAELNVHMYILNVAGNMWKING